MTGVPILVIQHSFTATGKYQYPEAVESVSESLLRIPTKFAIQVSGRDSAGASQAASAWDVIVEPSLDGINFNDMTTPMLEHVSTANSDGDVVWSGASGATFRGVRYLKINLKSVTLGSAHDILVTLLGLA